LDLKPEIVIVDDEPYILRVLKMKLEQGGYEVSIAVNGLEALEVIDRKAPSVVITDINMPYMSGQELCEVLQRRHGDRSFLMIVMTSGTDRAYRVWAEGMTNVRFVEKPFSPRQILKLVDQHFLEHREV